MQPYSETVYEVYETVLVIAPKECFTAVFLFAHTDLAAFTTCEILLL